MNPAQRRHRGPAVAIRAAGGCLPVCGSGFADARPERAPSVHPRAGAGTGAGPTRGHRCGARLAGLGNNGAGTLAFGGGPQVDDALVGRSAVGSVAGTGARADAHSAPAPSCPGQGGGRDRLRPPRRRPAARGLRGSGLRRVPEGAPRLIAVTAFLRQRSLASCRIALRPLRPPVQGHSATRRGVPAGAFVGPGADDAQPRPAASAIPARPAAAPRGEHGPGMVEPQAGPARCTEAART